MIRLIGLGAAALVVFMLPLCALAEGATPNAGDTAWVIVASALVLLMTLPGLAMYYAGLVRPQAVLSVVMQCFVIACLVSLLWLIVGYSLAFGASVGGLIGGLGKAFLARVTPDVVSGSIPEIVFAGFQMTFAVIAPALIVGAYVERIRFPAVLILSGAWTVLVYVPICHWIWGGGWLDTLGLMDFAGGLVVHASAGVSALAVAAMLGVRRGFPNQIHPPHNPGMTAVGAALLWVGWLGFNGGSQLAADGGTGMAIVATHIAAASAALVWLTIEWIRFGKTSLIGTVTGVIAGLATITPASGFVGPIGALLLGLAAGLACFFAAELVKRIWKIDDSLDVFAVHGVGGMLGTLLVALLATSALGGDGLAQGVTIGKQLGVQAVGLVATVVWSVSVTFVIVRVASALVGGLRVDEEDELVGLDLAAHGERGYDL